MQLFTLFRGRGIIVPVLRVRRGGAMATDALLSVRYRTCRWDGEIHDSLGIAGWDHAARK
jgi:hypothetical protein